LYSGKPVWPEISISYLFFDRSLVVIFLSSFAIHSFCSVVPFSSFPVSPLKYSAERCLAIEKNDQVQVFLIPVKIDAKAKFTVN